MELVSTGGGGGAGGGEGGDLPSQKWHSAVCCAGGIKSCECRVAVGSSSMPALQFVAGGAKDRVQALERVHVPSTTQAQCTQRSKVGCMRLNYVHA